MGSPLLLLRLEGPLQSWGLRSRWDVRDTGDEPSKSGIIGLLGCAFGYSRQDRRLLDLDTQLRMGVREERAGLRLTDFQTISGVMSTAEGGVKGREDDPSTILSPRTYLQDAAFLVVLEGPADVLAACSVALQAPQWPIYLGRKACVPSRPIFEAVKDEYISIKDALERYPWDWLGRTVVPERPEKLRIIWDDTAGEALRPDRVQGYPSRMYGNRTVQIDWVDFPGVKEEEPACT